MNFKKWVKGIQTAGYNDVRTVLKTEMPLTRNSKTVVTLIYELTDPKSFRVRPMLDLIGHQYFCHYIQSHHFSHPIFLCLHQFSFVEARLDALKKKVWTEKLNLYLLKLIYSEKATKFCKISTLLVSYAVPVKSKGEILSNSVTF